MYTIRLSGLGEFFGRGNPTEGWKDFARSPIESSRIPSPALLVHFCTSCIFEGSIDLNMIASAANVALKAPFSVSSASPSSPASKQRSPTLASPRVSRARGVVYAASELPGSGVEKEGPNFAPLKDIQAIQDVLPHRFPFLLVDRVLEWEYGKYAVGYKVRLR
jgi:hypothetical protein